MSKRSSSIVKNIFNIFVLVINKSYIKLIIRLYLDEVDTLEDVDIDDDVETELDVDTLVKNTGDYHLTFLRFSLVIKKVV